MVVVEIKDKDYFREEGSPGPQCHCVLMLNQRGFLQNKATSSDTRLTEVMATRNATCGLE